MQHSLSPSQEDYLEAIYTLSKEKRAVRSRDIARIMKVTRSSVTGALRALAEKGIIHYEPYEVVTLTPKGNSLARNIAHRHAVMFDFLVKVLGIDEKKAEQQACLLEHALSGEVAHRFRSFIHFLELCPKGLSAWSERFQHYCADGDQSETCAACAGANKATAD